MTTALISYTDMQRMAKTAADSKMFGVKTPDEALAIMLVAHAEGIHPMTAMRDYHVISGRPSLKADTMLARFQQSGGSVEWHSNTDTKAEATFTHPKGGSLRLDWTIERAKAAGLAGRDTWKAYPRAMLKARLISEGIRTVYPGVLIGAYTPEEISDIIADPVTVSAEQAVQSFGKPGLPQDQVDEAMEAISNATEVNKLMHVYQAAYKAAREVGDEARMNSFKLAYDARKDELTAVPVAGEVI